MKKSILNLGITLNQTAQKKITGGNLITIPGGRCDTVEIALLGCPCNNYVQCERNYICSGGPNGVCIEG